MSMGADKKARTGACELAAVRGVDVVATTSQTPPARHPEVYALGGDAVWAIDLSAGPSGKFKTRVPVAGTPDANRHGTDGGGRGESRYGSPDGGRQPWWGVVCGTPEDLVVSLERVTR